MSSTNPSPISPVDIYELDPADNGLNIRLPGPTRVTDEPADNIAEIQRRMESGLFSSDNSNALRPASRGAGRSRHR